MNKMVRKEGKGPLGNSIELIRAPVTAEEMRNLEDRGVALGISKLVMMENAGHSIADEVKKYLNSETDSTREESGKGSFHSWYRK